MKSTIYRENGLQVGSEHIDQNFNQFNPIDINESYGQKYNKVLEKQS